MILADRWSSLDELLSAHRPLRLDLGCGWVKEPGYVGLDDLRGVEGLMGQLPNDERGPDVFLDLNADAYPFPDGSVDEVRSRHFLEHSLLDHVFGESHRLLRPGGGLVSTLPSPPNAPPPAPRDSPFLTERFFERNPSFQAKFAIERITFRQSEEWER